MGNRSRRWEDPYPGFAEGVEEAHRYMTYIRGCLRRYDFDDEASSVIEEMDKAYDARRYRKRVYDQVEELTPEITKEYLYSIYVIFGVTKKGEALLSRLGEMYD